SRSASPVCRRSPSVRSFSGATIAWRTPRRPWPDAGRAPWPKPRRPAERSDRKGGRARLAARPAGLCRDRVLALAVADLALEVEGSTRCLRPRRLRREGDAVVLERDVPDAA